MTEKEEMLVDNEIRKSTEQMNENMRIVSEFDTLATLEFNRVTHTLKINGIDIEADRITDFKLKFKHSRWFLSFRKKGTDFFLSTPPETDSQRGSTGSTME